MSTQPLPQSAGTAQPGRRRDHARRASEVRATTRASQLIRPAVMIAGEAAIMSASQGRESFRCVQTRTPKRTNSTTAFTPKYSAAEVATCSEDSPGAVWPPSRLVRRRVKSINAPVRTGYSRSACR